MTHRDIVVIGASAGGVEALPRILGQLPSDFSASISIVLHLSAAAESSFAAILSRQSRLPVEWIEQGARLEPGHVYVAPPNLHALMVDRHLQLAGGAKESRARPSIDRLFRSAAATHGGRTIGALLTGMLDDGVAGLCAVQQAGGFTIVQDPDTAAFPELPSRALVALIPDRVLPIDSIGPLLVELTREPTADVVPPPRIGAEARLDRRSPQDPSRDRSDGKQRRDRSYLGHVANAQRLLETSTDNVETALWSAIRALHESATMFDGLAGDASRAGNPESHHVYLARANRARSQADTARAFMLDLAALGPSLIP